MNARSILVALVGLLALSSQAAEPGLSGINVLKEDFKSGTASAAWSDRTVSTSPNGSINYLGNFGPGTVSLSLSNLPPHRALNVSFKLHILGSWDGVGHWGPDRWRCGLRDGPVFMETTFNNCFLIWCDNIWQSFPEYWHPIQQEVCKAMNIRPDKLLASHGGSGATSVADLGWTWGKHPQISTTYSFSFTVPHDETLAVIDFSNLCDDPRDDQSFALGDVSVEALNEVPPSSDADVEKAWQDLLTGSPATAFDAGRCFLAHPDELLRHAADLVSSEPSRIQNLMLRLDDGPTRAEGINFDVEPGNDTARIAALRELTLMPGNIWTNRSQHDPFDAAHPQRTRTLQTWIYVTYDKTVLTSAPIVRAAMRLASLLRQNGTARAVELATVIEARTSLPPPIEPPAPPNHLPPVEKTPKTFHLHDFVSAPGP